ncbi:MAG: immunoglobulin domain-containing protein, partial [Gammaproteobacteria bacterium]|nr:immunoglobulin domain-containing protein [Gammaproteobacteria bacterium]MBU1480278.1 immunoglobulin domain-containing protein [Gammaproteobacteria bacterium]
MLIFILSGCGGGVADEPKNEALTASLASISIAPATPGIVQGGTQQFVATGTLTDDSTVDLTSDATWNSTDTTTATVTSAGLATATGPGETTIEASYGGRTNSTLLTVTAVPVAPAITTQPANRSVTAGQAATFNVAVSGTMPITYQWRRNGTNVGTNSASYTTPATVLTDSGASYSVVVSNSAGDVTSNNATLTVTAVPAITTQPANVSIMEGQAATFNVIATGSAPLSYQWRKNGTNIVGANSASYTTPATLLTDSGASYSVVVSNSAGDVTSNNATLTVTATPVAPAITTQPANKSVTVGQTATFNVIATGTAPLSYQWRKGGTNVGTNSA